MFIFIVLNLIYYLFIYLCWKEKHLGWKNESRTSFLFLTLFRYWDKRHKITKLKHICRPLRSQTDLDVNVWRYRTRSGSEPVLQTQHVLPAGGGASPRCAPRRRSGSQPLLGTSHPAEAEPWSDPERPSPSRRSWQRHSREFNLLNHQEFIEL